MKKKIFFIMSTDDFSGAEIVNKRIISYLKNDYDFYWVSRAGNINSFLDEFDIKWIEIKKLSVREIRRIVKDYKPDILHATDYRASVICAMAKTKVILIEHLHNNPLWLKKININALMFLYAGMKANQILTVSESIRKEYVFSRFISKKIICVDNPVSRKEILSKVENVNKSKLYDICCVGRLTIQKKPLRFLSIIEKLHREFPDIKVCWVGDGELLDECEKNLENQGLEDIVKFLGYKKNPYVIMNQSRIFMLTSAWEGFGLVAFEALSLGLPCVVSNVGGLTSIVNTSCGYLCESEQDFISAAKKLLIDKNLYTRMSVSAEIRAKNLDNESEYMSRIANIYDQLLEKNNE